MFSMCFCLARSWWLRGMRDLACFGFGLLCGGGRDCLLFGVVLEARGVDFEVRLGGMIGI